jgi:hypothetical protein
LTAGSTASRHNSPVISKGRILNTREVPPLHPVQRPMRNQEKLSTSTTFPVEWLYGFTEHLLRISVCTTQAAVASKGP